MVTTKCDGCPVTRATQMIELSAECQQQASACMNRWLPAVGRFMPHRHAMCFWQATIALLAAVASTVPPFFATIQWQGDAIAAETPRWIPYPRDIRVLEGPVTPPLWERIDGCIGDVSIAEPFVELAEDHALRLSRVFGNVFISARTLTTRSAEHLGRHRGVLCISGLSEISDDVALGLGRHRGTLLLPQAITISDTALHHLCETQGELELGVRNMPPAQARLLLGHSGGRVALPCVHQISVETAVALSEGRWPLRIGLVEMCPDVAGALSLRAGLLDFAYPVSEGGHLRVDPLAARALARYKGDLSIALRCDGEADKVLAALSHHPGSLELLLDVPLSPPMARAISKHEAPLRLVLQQPLSHTAAVELAAHRGKLYIDSASGVSSEVARALSHHRGTGLWFTVSELDESAASAIAAYRGSVGLYPPGVAAVKAPAESVAALAKHVGMLRIPSEFVREDTIKGLVEHRGGLTVAWRQSEKPASELVQRLADCKDVLYLDGQLSDECVEAIAGRAGDLVLRCFPRSDTAAAALLSRKGRVSFTGECLVPSIGVARLAASEHVRFGYLGIKCLLSAEAQDIAAILASRQGPLELPCLRYVHQRALRSLTTKENVGLPPLHQLYVFNDDGEEISAADIVPDSFKNDGRQRESLQASPRAWWE